jgi:phosphate-selective porin OprO/OprP
MSRSGSFARSVLLAGVATIALSGAAFAQDAPPKHHHHDTDADRFELLEKQLQEQNAAIKQQADEIQSLKSQLAGGGQALATQAQFTALENKVDTQEAETHKQALVTFQPQTPYQRRKDVPTISTRDGNLTWQPYAMVQGDFSSYSKGQPLSVAGTNNLKASGENFRRARIGFNGTFDKDFGYSFIYDFGGAGGDETYQGFAAANSGTTTNSGGKSITPYTTSTGAGTGPHIYRATISYKGILDPFQFIAGLMATPANLGDTTQSDDLLFIERPSPSQIGRSIAGDDGRESVGFLGFGDNWNASFFLSGDTYGKAPLIAPATTYAGGQEALVGRAVFLPIRGENNLNVHLGVNGTYVVHPAEATSTANPGVTTFPIVFSDRPELRTDNISFINTGSSIGNATSAYVAGVEAAASWGPILIQGENFWYGAERNAPAAGVTNPHFSGWYVEGTYSLTGDPHPYNPANGSFTRPSPAVTFDPRNGGWGTWELAGRYSSTNLDYDIGSANTLDRVFGGEQNIWTAGVNFYPDDLLRFVFDWQDVLLKNIGAAGDNGHYRTLSARAQVSF